MEKRFKSFEQSNSLAVVRCKDLICAGLEFTLEFSSVTAHYLNTLLNELARKWTRPQWLVPDKYETCCNEVFETELYEYDVMVFRSKRNLLSRICN